MKRLIGKNNIFLIVTCAVFMLISLGLASMLKTERTSYAASDSSIFTFVQTGETECNVRLSDKTVELAIIPSTAIIDNVEYTVTEIAASGFSSASNLKKVRLPRTIKSIGSSAFANCKQLYSITMPNVEQIGTNAFNLCTSLDYLIIPESVQYVSSTILRNTSTQVYVRVSQEKTQELGWSATWNGNNTNQAVEYNSQFTPEIEYKEVIATNTLTRTNQVIGYYVDSAQPFSEKREEYEYVYIPAVHEGYPVLGIADSAFTYNEIKSLIVGYSNTPIFIGSYAFNGVGLVEEKDVEGSQIIINRDIDIITDEGEISEDLFSDSTVSAIILPDSLSVFGDRMFQNCVNLKYLQFISPVDVEGKEEEIIGISTSASTQGAILPNSITHIGEEVFSGATSLPILEIPQSVEEVGARILVGWNPPQIVKIYFDTEADLPNGWASSWKNGCAAGVIQFQGKFKIQYEPDDGTHFGNPTEYMSSDSIVLKDAQEIGHTFEGWYDNKEFNGDPITVIGLGSTGDLTLYAKLVENEYSIKYCPNKPEKALSEVEGTMGNSFHTYNLSAPLSQNGFSLYGWEFIGWGLTKDSLEYRDKEEVINLTTEANVEITLYAQWQIKQYEVIYSPNKPDNATGVLKGSMGSSSFDYDTEYVLSANNYSLFGWEFVGWNTKFDGSGKPYSNEDSVLNITENENSEIHLFAQWEPIGYSVSYKPNKPSNASHEVVGNMTSSDHFYDHESELSKNAFTLYGWEFVGWNTAADGSGQPVANSAVVKVLGNSEDNGLFNKEIELYAQWEARQYTVYYYGIKPAQASNNVTGSMSVSNFTYDTTSYLSANSFLLKGWTFTCWKDSTGNKEYSDKAAITSPILDDSFTLKLSTQWTPYKYTVIYNMNAPTKADVKSGSTANSNFEYDYSGTLQKNGYLITGWEFIGWNTNSAGTGTPFTAGQVLKNMNGVVTITNGCQITLYAQWKPILYTITLNPNGGSGGTTKIQLYYRDPLPKIEAPSRTGHDFLGYYSYHGVDNYYYDGNVGIKINEWRDVQVTEIFADWDPREYRITFVAAQATLGTKELNVKYGDYPASIQIPTRLGYKFIGYYTRYDLLYDMYKYFDSEGKPTQPYCIADNSELYAIFEGELYYTLNVWHQGGDITAAETLSSKSVRIDMSITLKAPEYSGHEFKEWRHTGDSSIEYMEVLTTNTVMYIDSLVVTEWFEKVGTYKPVYNVYAYYESTCIDEDTLITLADGSQKAVQDLTGDEELLVWNLMTGSFDRAPILFIESHQRSVCEVIGLTFGDGSEVNVIYEHAFWDCNLNRYVYLDKNASRYIGHWFNKQVTDSSGNLSWEKVQLVSVDIFEKYTTAWSLVTYSHLCYYVNGMLSMPGGISGLFNIFEVDADAMKYNEAAMRKDIEEYGLFTYAEFSELVPVSEAVFEAFNGRYLKIAIGKGFIDVSTLENLAERYGKFFVEQ